MLLVSDVHGAWDALGAVAQRGEPLLVLGDLLNLIDHRTLEGLLVDIFGRQMVAEVAELRLRGDHSAARRRWRAEVAGREAEVKSHFENLITDSYRKAAAALEGHGAYVTYGNVDRPDLLREMLPADTRFVDGETAEIEGFRVGFAGGGIGPDPGAPGVITEEEMWSKLRALGEVDVLCTHAAPALRELSEDVIAGGGKHSKALLDFIVDSQPGHHYFGDIHQPKATTWRVGTTICRNVGYFRATGRPVRHG